MQRDAEAQRLAARKELIEVESRRHEIVARLRAFLYAESELLAHFDGNASPLENPGSGFLKPAQSTAYARSDKPARTEAAPLSDRKEPASLPLPKNAPAPEKSVPEPQRLDLEHGGWTVRPVLSQPQGASQPPPTPQPPPAPQPAPQRDARPAADSIASEEELERIRRILNELD